MSIWPVKIYKAEITVESMIILWPKVMKDNFAKLRKYGLHICV